MINVDDLNLINGKHMKSLCLHEFNFRMGDNPNVAIISLLSIYFNTF